MNGSKRLQLQERIIALARIKGTGSLSELATFLDTSERTIKRLIKELRDQGVLIRFDRTRRSYVIDV